MPQRRYSREFKLSAVKLVNEQGYSVPQAARSLGIDAGNVRNWVEKLSGEDGVAPSGEGALKSELRRLRKLKARSKRGAKYYPAALTTPKQRPQGDLSTSSKS